MEDLYCDEVLTQTEPATAFSPDLGYYGSEDTVPAHHHKSSEYMTSMPNFRKAHIDTILLEDSRVFRNMLTTEECYVSDNNYFENVQKEIKPHMRKHVTDWMLEVCIDQGCHVDVFLISCNIMDRFLSQVNISKKQFQLVATATIFIASKLVEPFPINGTTLVEYTDNLYQLTELLEMELVILSRLNWDLCAVTPYSFLEYLLRLILGEDTINQNEKNLFEEIKKQAQPLIILCAHYLRFSMYPPSMLSSAALAHAAQDLNRSSGLQFNVNELINRLQILTQVENDCLNDCIYQIELTKEENRPKTTAYQQQQQTPVVNTSQNSENSDQTPLETLANAETTETKDDVPIYMTNQIQKTPPLSPEKSTTPTEVVVVSSSDFL